MRARLAFLLISVFAYTTLGHDSLPSQTTPDFEPIAVASIKVDKDSFKSGEDISDSELSILTEAEHE